MKTITIFKKAVSITVTASLLLSFVISPSTASVIINEETANQYSKIFDNFVLPYSYGQVTKAHYAGTDRVVINIQDLHCHPKVQRNISNIIETFDNSYGVNKVYLEGAYGKVDTSWINNKIQEYGMPELLDKMLETGRLTGAEYYSALSGKNQIISGLEEKGPYLENLKRFGNIIENQEKINLILNAVEESTKELKEKYYTKKQHNIDEISQKYKEGKINTEKYYSLLSKHIDKLGIDLSRYENTLRYIMLMNLQKNLKTANITKELQSLVLSIKEKIPYDSYKKLLGYTDNFTKTDKLFSFISAMPELNINLSSNYKNLDKYFRYIELSKKVNPVELVNEEVKLTQEINTRFSQTKQQRDIVFLTSFERYLQNYLNSKITSQDYKYYSDNIAKYKELWNKYVDNRVLSLLDDYIKQADSFYKTNNERNIYFANKIFENEKTNKIEDSVEAEEDINKIIGNIDKVKKLDIVITGGFHSQTVTELLESKNVSYIVITPKIAQDTKFAQDTYYQLAKEQSEINFQTLAPAIASLSPELQNKILNMVSNSSYKEEQISALDNEGIVKLISDLAAAKILESDDIGKLEEKLQEIVKDFVDDSYRDRVTPELISKIKNLQELLKDKEQLQKAIDLLGEDSVAKQSVMLVSDTFDYLDNLLDTFLIVNENISQETGISKKTYFDEEKNKNKDVKKNINEFFSQVNIDAYKADIISKIEGIIGEKFEIKKEGFEVKEEHNSYYPSTTIIFTIIDKETKQSYEVLLDVYTNLYTDLFSMEIKGNAGREKLIPLLDKLAREIMAGNLKKEYDQSVEKIEKSSKVYYDETKSKSKTIKENIETFFAQANNKNKSDILSEFKEIIGERAEIKKDSLGKEYFDIKEQRHSFYPVKTITMTVTDKQTKQEYEISVIAFNNLGDLVFSIEINGDSKRTEYVGLADKIALEIMNGRLNKSAKSEQDKTEQKDKVSKLYYDEAKSKSKAISENIDSFFSQAYEKENEAVILSEFGEILGNSVEIKKDSFSTKKLVHNSYPADVITMTIIDKNTKQEYEVSVIKFLNLDEINLIIEINGDSNRENYVQFVDKIATGIMSGKIIAKKIEQQPEKQIGDSNKSYYDEGKKTDSSIRDNIDTFFAQADSDNRERLLSKIEETIGEVFEIEDDGVNVKIDRHPYYPTSIVKLPVIDRTTGQKYEISIVNFINLDLANFSINIKGDASREKYLPLLDKLAENIMSGSIETGKILSLNKNSQLQKQTTQEILDKIGNNKIIKKIYKEKGGDSFKFTTLGLAIGVFVETFSFWSPNFVERHDFDPSIKSKMSMVVNNMRIVSVWIGIIPAILSLVNPISSLFIIPTIIFMEWIIHFIYNKIQLVKRNDNLLLQNGAKNIEIEYSKDTDKFMIFTIVNSDGDRIAIRFIPRRNAVYVSAINDNAYSITGSPYNTIESIKDFLGITINLEDSKIIFDNIPSDFSISYIRNKNIDQTVENFEQKGEVIVQEEEIEKLKEEINASKIEIIYLDKDWKLNKAKIKDAVTNHKLIVIYPFSKTYDIDSLSDEELLSLYASVSDKFFEIEVSLFPRFAELYSEEYRYMGMEFFLKEYVKNAFVHGNLSDPSKPIYVDCSEGIVSVYNRINEENIDEKDLKRRIALSAASTLTGQHVGLDMAQRLERGLVSQDIQIKTIGTDKYYIVTLKNLNWVAKNEKSKIKQAISDTYIKTSIDAQQKKSNEITELPEQFTKFADNYNQYENNDNLPSIDYMDYEKREAYQEFFEDDVFAVTNMSQKIKFEGNTKYVYILQNQRNNEALFDVLKMQDIEMKFKLFALMYLEKMSRGFSNEEKELFETLKVQVIEQFKDAVANNKFDILNNFDLRSYLTGIYSLMADFCEKENISYIANKAKFMISRALIVNPDGKTLATSDGFFAQADFFTLVHELTHVMITKPGFSNKVAFDTIDELVSYITPNLIMKLVNFSVEAYKKISFKYYTLHYGKDSLDYVRMGSKFQALYNLFSDKTEDFVLEQDEHRSAIAFLDLLFYAHKHIGTQVSFDVLLKTITENMSNAKEVNQETMYYILLDKYFENLIKENVLSEQEVQNLRKETEKIQLWTLMSSDIIGSIEQDSPEILKEILGSKTPALFYNQLLATPNMTKEFLEINKVAETLKTKQSLTKKDIINLLIMEEVIGKADYEMLAYNIDNVIFGIINITSDAFKLIDSAKINYSLDDYNEIKNYFENNYSYINNTEQSNEIDISVTDNMIDFISSSIDKIFFINNLINVIFFDDTKTLNLSSRNLVITNSSQQTRTLNDLISAENISDAFVVSMEIIKTQETDLRGGIMLDVNNGIRVKYDKSNSKLIVYSKKGITLSEEEIKDMIVQSYYDTREEDAFEGAIAFVDSSVQSVQAMENKLKNEYTNSVVMANKETKFDISQRNVTDLATMCKQESIATGTKTFVISIQQAKMFETQIKSLQENDFKFIVVYKSYQDFDGIIYDGIKINLSSVASVQEALDLLEKIKKESLKKGVDISISVQFNEDIYKAFEQQNINIFERYGILPIISSDSKYVVSRNIGRTEVENITRENIDQILRNDNIASIVVDDATVICDKRSENKKIRTKEQKYNKGYKAALSSKFDYTVSDVKTLFDFMDIDLHSESLNEQLDNLNLSLLSNDSRSYIEYLKSGGKYEEILGFIRGIVMNTVAKDIAGIIDLDKDAVFNDKKNKTLQAILIITIQKMMNGESLEEMYKTTSGSDELSAKDYLDSIMFKINESLDKVLRENEYKITKQEPSAIADFNGIPELLSDIYGHRATVSNDVEVSIGAIKSILSAA